LIDYICGDVDPVLLVTFGRRKTEQKVISEDVSSLVPMKFATRNLIVMRKVISES